MGDQDLSIRLRDIIAHKDDDGAEDPGEYLTVLVTSAVHDDTPRYTLKEIYAAIANSGGVQSLDAMHGVPLLVNSGRDGAGDLIGLLAECGNAKEVVIAAHESLERLKNELRDGDNEDEQVNTYKRLSNILTLYIGTIPRIKPRKRSSLDTIRPLVADINATLRYASQHFSKEQSHDIMQRVCDLLSSVLVLVTPLDSADVNEDPSEGNVKDLCRDLLLQSVEVLSPLTNFDLAQRKFGEIYPRLVMRGAPNAANTDTTLLSRCLGAIELLNISQDELLRSQSIGGLALFAYTLIKSPTSDTAPQTPTVLDSSLPVLLSSLQTSLALDETLYILLSTLNSPSEPTLSPDTLIPLIGTLVPLASTHPVPQTRHIIFKLLGTLLSRLPSLDRMFILRDLLSDSEDTFPPMRIAAVGLLKDAVLEALASEKKSPFATPTLFDAILGKILKFDFDGELHELVETGGSKRSVELLSFYYILLVRDSDNRTSVRDPSNLKSVCSNFLRPLRSSVDKCKELEVEDHELQFALVALDIALQRVEDQLTLIK